MNSWVPIRVFGSPRSKFFKWAALFSTLPLIFSLLGIALVRWITAVKVTARNRTAFGAPRGPVAAREMASALRLLQLDLLEAEVGYGNRKRIFLFRAFKPPDGDCERAANESAAPA
jgi:hypothetical protein